MFKIIGLLCGLALCPSMATAQDIARFAIGHDVYLAANAPTFSGDAATQDLFMVGQIVTAQAPVQGAAHLAGSKVGVTGAVGSDLFAAGYAVMVQAPVGGDATLVGYEVTLAQGAGGNLRVGANDLTVGGAVGGYALLSAARLTMNAVVAGDMVLAVDAITWGPDARVQGALTIYAADPSVIKVPETVAPAARVKIVQRTADNAREWDTINPVHVSPWSAVSGMVSAIVATGLVALLVLALAPDQVKPWREVVSAHPWRALMSGFLVASALAGSGIVLALTFVGVVLIPVVVLALLAAVFAGYALGSYVLGSALWLALGRVMPEALPGKFGLALLGASGVALAGFVPVLGWLIALGVTLMGMGALAAMVLPGNMMLNRGHIAGVAGR